MKNKNRILSITYSSFFFWEKNNLPKFEKVLPHFDSDFSLVVNFFATDLFLLFRRVSTHLLPFIATSPLGMLYCSQVTNLKKKNKKNKKKHRLGSFEI